MSGGNLFVGDARKVGRSSRIQDSKIQNSGIEFPVGRLELSLQMPIVILFELACNILGLKIRKAVFSFGVSNLVSALCLDEKEGKRKKEDLNLL